jgi:hypothetical protein
MSFNDYPRTQQSDVDALIDRTISCLVSQGRELIPA